MAIQIQTRRDTAANWTSNDPTLAEGEIGFETDTEQFKIGDGTTVWSSLNYFTVSSGTWTDTSTNTGTNKTFNDFTNFIDADSVHEQMRNESGGAMTVGDAVYISGYSVGQERVLVTLADSDAAGTMPSVAILEDATLANNATGHFIEVGTVANMKTDDWSVGDELYVSGTGTTTNTLTSTKPTGTALVQKVAVVLRSHATLGVIEIFGAGRANNVPNEYLPLVDNSMVDTLHRHSELSASDGAPDQALTVDAAGRVNITNDFSVDSDLLFVDIAGNVGVGIGTGTPSEMLDVVGNAEINGNIIVTGTVDGINIATDVAANTLKDTNVTTNITVVEAPTNVDIQSSDGTNDTIAAADVTNAGVMTTTMFDEHVVNTAHALDNTQAHSDYLLNSGTDTAVGPLKTTADNSSADTEYIPNVLYNTDATPPTASTVPIGTIYVQYTA